MAIVDGKVVFDETEQAEVNRIVQERLARVKAEKPEDYDDLKAIESELEDFGYSGTPAEKKAAIKAYKEELKRQQQSSSAGTYAEAVGQIADSGEIPDDKVINALAKKFGVSPNKIEKAIKKAIDSDEADEQKQQQDENWNKQVKEFAEAHAGIDLKVLNADEDFVEYASGRSGTLKTLYEGYVKFTSKLKEKTADEVAAKYKAKELGSTGSGKGGKQEAGEYGLTERQKNLAKSSGMSYKRYAELLQHA